MSSRSMVSRWRLQDRNRNQFGKLGGFVVPFLDRMQCGSAGGEVLFVFLIPARNAGVKIPAVEIKTRARRRVLQLRRATFSRCG